MAEAFANSEDSDQMPRSVASDLGLHCLPITLLGVSRQQWVIHLIPVIRKRIYVICGHQKPRSAYMSMQSNCWLL